MSAVVKSEADADEVGTTVCHDAVPPLSTGGSSPERSARLGAGHRVATGFTGRHAVSGVLHLTAPKGDRSGLTAELRNSSTVMASFDAVRDSPTRKMEEELSNAALVVTPTLSYIRDGGKGDMNGKRKHKLHLNEESMLALQEKRKRLSKLSGEESDNYCWVCHKQGTVQLCDLCPRGYHSKCVAGTAETDPLGDWLCPECERVMRAECLDTRSKAMTMITLEQLCLLLKFALQRMKHAGSEPFHLPVDTDLVPQYRDFIVHPLDLSTVEKNIKQKQYGCTEAFLADIKWILHNCIVFNGTHHDLTGCAKAIVKICKHEMTEIEVCPDCYMSSCVKRNDENWFCEPCRKPHTLVWAKLKGYPFWPAKALREVDGQVDVRFFGAHDRAWVPATHVLLLSKECPTVSKNRKGGFDGAMREVELHVQNIREKLGHYEYAAFRTLYSTDRSLLTSPGVGPAGGGRKAGTKSGLLDGVHKPIKKNLTPKGYTPSPLSALKLTFRGGVAVRLSAERAMTPTSAAGSQSNTATAITQAATGAALAVTSRPTRHQRLASKRHRFIKHPHGDGVTREGVRAGRSKREPLDRDCGGGDGDMTFLASVLNGGVPPMNTVNRLADEQVPPVSQHLPLSTGNRSHLSMSRVSPVRVPKYATQLPAWGSPQVMAAGSKALFPKPPIEQPKGHTSPREDVAGLCESATCAAPAAATSVAVFAAEAAASSAVCGISFVAQRAQTFCNIGIATLSGACSSGACSTALSEPIVGSSPKVAPHHKVTKADNVENVCGVSADISPPRGEQPAEAVRSSVTTQDGLASSGAARKDVFFKNLEKTIESCKAKLGLSETELHEEYSESEDGDEADMPTGGMAASSSGCESDSGRRLAAGACSNIDRDVSLSHESCGTTMGSLSANTSASSSSITTANGDISVVDSCSVPAASGSFRSGNDCNSQDTERDAPQVSGCFDGCTAAVTLANSVSEMAAVAASASMCHAADKVAHKTVHNNRDGCEALPANGDENSGVESSSGPAVAATTQASMASCNTILATKFPLANSTVTAQSVAPGTESQPGETAAQCASEAGAGEPRLEHAAVADAESSLASVGLAGDPLQSATACKTGCGSTVDGAELSHLQALHKSEMDAIKHNTELTVTEMRKAFELDKQRAQSKIRKQLEDKMKKIVAETKKKQWCAYCGEEAIFYCCWNTSYCDYPCQQRHWTQHMATCAQVRSETGSDSGGAVASAVAAVDQGRSAAVVPQSQASRALSTIASATLPPSSRSTSTIAGATLPSTSRSTSSTSQHHHVRPAITTATPVVMGDDYRERQIGQLTAVRERLELEKQHVGGGSAGKFLASSAIAAARQQQQASASTAMSTILSAQAALVPMQLILQGAAQLVSSCASGTGGTGSSIMQKVLLPSSIGGASLAAAASAAGAVPRYSLGQKR